MAFIVSAVATAFEISAFAAVSAIGMATSVVGLVTGNKDLMKIGGVLGLAGGVGSLAAGAMNAAGGAAASSAGDSLASLGGSSDSFLANGMGSQLATDGAAGLGAGIDAANAGAEFGASTYSVPDPSSAFDVGDSFTANGIGSPMATDPGGVIGGAMSPTTPSVSSLNAPSGGLQTASAPPVESTLTSNIGTTPNPTPVSNDILDTPGIKDAGYGSGTVSQGTAVNNLKAKLGAMWESLGPQAKAELVKSAMAIPGGIQKQKNDEAMLALNQQKINQTSYGNSVPTFGIINTARG